MAKLLSEKHPVVDQPKKNLALVLFFCLSMDYVHVLHALILLQIFTCGILKLHNHFNLSKYLISLFSSLDFLPLTFLVSGMTLSNSSGCWFVLFVWTYVATDEEGGVKFCSFGSKEK